MNTRDTFNLSVSEAEKQKKQQYEQDREETARRKREKDISRIQDEEKKREVRTMLNARDKELADERGRQEELIQRAGDDAVSRDRLENHKFEQYAPEREDYVRTQIRQRMELDFAPENKAHKQELNLKIDEYVEKTLESERQNELQQSPEDQKQSPQLSFSERLIHSSQRENAENRNWELSRDVEPDMERKP
jgi:hypothetical protein